MRSKSRLARSPGQSTLEFALTVLALMIFLFVIFDLGFAVFIMNTVSVAAREGARTAIVCRNPDSLVISQVQTALMGLSQGATIQGPTVGSGGVPCANGYRNHGAVVTVTVSYTYSFFLPEVYGRPSVTLVGISQMIVE